MQSILNYQIKLHQYKSYIIFDTVILFAAVLHLQAGDWLSPQFRYIGDALMMLLLLASLGLNKKHTYTTKGLVQAGWIFLIINLAYIVYSFVLWGELIYIIRLARQPLLSAVYLIITFYFTNTSLHSPKNDWLFWSLLLFLTINTILASFGVVTPLYSERAVVFQNLPVEKVFIKGSVAAYLLPIVLSSFKLRRHMILSTILGNIYILFVAIYIIRFRYWFIIMFVGFGLIVLIAWLNNRSIINKLKIFVILSLISIISIIIFMQTNIYSYIINWLSSGVNDIVSQQGTFLYRLERDISRINYQFRDNIIHVLFGYGFVHKDSRAVNVLGFSSETNDVGFVQFAITYGVVGTFIYFAIWIRTLLTLFRASRLQNSLPYGSAAVIGLIMIFSSFSSNFLLWETFFIPCFIAMRLLMSRGLIDNRVS